MYEVQDVRGTRLACKVVTKTSLKTKKAKTKVCRRKPESNIIYLWTSSCTPRLRSIEYSNIPMSFVSRIVLKMTKTST